MSPKLRIINNYGAGGDGIYAENSAVTLTNNIIALNLYGLRVTGAITATISNNDVWGNITADYSGLPDPTGSQGNIKLDPRFVAGPLGSYYLSQTAAGQSVNSPCVDAGSASAASLGLDQLTTRTDVKVDQGIVDLGYHYLLIYGNYLPVILKN